MKNFLEKIRSKDEPQKVMIAFISALVITAVIVITWFTASSVSNKEVATEEVAPKKADEVTPILNIESQVSEIKTMFEEVMVKFKDSKEIIESGLE